MKAAHRNQEELMARLQAESDEVSRSGTVLLLVLLDLGACAPVAHAPVYAPVLVAAWLWWVDCHQRLPTGTDKNPWTQWNWCGQTLEASSGESMALRVPHLPGVLTLCCPACAHAGGAPHQCAGRRH